MNDFNFSKQKIKVKMKAVAMRKKFVQHKLRQKLLQLKKEELEVIEEFINCSLAFFFLTVEIDRVSYYTK